MEMFNIYLIGGMMKFADDFKKSNKWRKYLKEKFEYCLSMYNVRVINPNDYYSFIPDKNVADSEREIMEFDLNKVRNSKLCICNFNDVYSLGSMAELAIAYDRRIPVIGLCENNENLHPWQEEMITKKFTNIEELALYVIDYYLK